MNLIKYQTECQNTKSNRFFAERVSKMFFVNAVFAAIESLQRLDAIKKSLFYGKSSTQFPVNGIIEDGVETCAALQIHNLHDFPQPGLDILHGIIGKATEAAELLEAMLRAVGPVNPDKLDRVNIIEEVGDGFWYDGIILDAVNSNFHEVARINNAKLKKRFPDKFKTEDAITRDLDAERATLEDKESAGDMLQRLGVDGDLWAREFVKRVQMVAITETMDDRDRAEVIDTLRAWIVNAIEAGASHERKRYKDDAFPKFIEELGNDPNTWAHAFIDRIGKSATLDIMRYWFNAALEAGRKEGIAVTKADAEDAAFSESIATESETIRRENSG